MGCNEARECEIGPDALGDTAMLWQSLRERAEAVLEMRGQLGGVSRLCPAKISFPSCLNAFVPLCVGLRATRAVAVSWALHVKIERRFLNSPVLIPSRARSSRSENVLAPSARSGAGAAAEGIGAGAVVVTDIPAGATAVGVPARAVGKSSGEAKQE